MIFVAAFTAIAIVALGIQFVARAFPRWTDEEWDERQAEILASLPPLPDDWRPRHYWNGERP